LILQNKKIIGVILLLIICGVVFLYTVEIRRQWFGTLSEGHHQWLSGNTLKFSKDWYVEGPLHLKFLMLRNPRSVEFPTLFSRLPLFSYPPGCVLPIYVISKLRGHVPTVSLLMKYNLINHFLIAYLLSLTVFFFLTYLKFNYWGSFILSLVPIFLELLLPAPLYWHQNVFFADQAVILPFVLIVFLEVNRENVRNKTISGMINSLQAVVFLYGILTDWLFIFIMVTVYIKRILYGESGRCLYSFCQMSIKYFSPAIVGLVLYLVQLQYSGFLARMIHKFFFRTGLGNGGDRFTVKFYERFWEGHISAGYGEISILLLWGSLIIFTLSLIYSGAQYLRKKSIPEELKRTFSLIGILLIPCFLQVYTFRNHCAIHDFSALKMSVPLSTVPFVLIPVLLYFLSRIQLRRDSFQRLKTLRVWRRRNRALIIIISGSFLLVGIYLGKEHPHFKDLFPEPNETFEINGRFIASNTRYEDIVFSPDYENVIPDIPPQGLSYSMKRVYKISSILNIYNIVEDIDGYFEINIFLKNRLIDSVNENIKELISAAYDFRQSGDLVLYKIKMEDFFNIWEKRKGITVNNVDHTDFNGDGESDITIFRKDSGLWLVRGITRLHFGFSSKQPVPGDYTGNGRSDFGVFREDSGVWAIRGITRCYFGSSSDKAVSGDYNGDGTYDIGVFSEGIGLWAIRDITRFYFGLCADNPVPGDYTGDGTWTAGIFRAQSGLWILREISRYYFGNIRSVAVPGDYDGDGTWETGVFQMNDGLWSIRNITRCYFGSSLSEPVPADYDGDSTLEMGIFNKKFGLWAVRGMFRCYYGNPGDIPVTR